MNVLLPAISGLNEALAVKTVLPRQIKHIRAQMNASQEMFALLNMPLVTAKSWGAGRREPSGAAVRLLQLAERQPKMLLETASYMPFRAGAPGGS